jgi:pilus assembly protein Flp/PilA
MKEQLIKFLREEEGLTTVEYAVAGALITIAVVTAFTDLGAAVAQTIGEIADAVLTRPAAG